MFQIIIKLLLSALLGGLIGYEREKHGRPAGIRTHLLVCLGSCLTMVVSLNLASYDLADPSRIASMVMAGIGFLGAGVIVKQKGGNIWGLTTAAYLWITAALGLSVGCGLYIPSIAVVIISIVSLIIFKSLEQCVKRDEFYTLVIETLQNNDGLLNEIINTLNNKDIKVLNISFDKNNNMHIYTIRIKTKNDINNYFINYLYKLPCVTRIICK